MYCNDKVTNSLNPDFMKKNVKWRTFDIKPAKNISAFKTLIKILNGAL